MEKEIVLTIDREVLGRYEDYYFRLHPRAKKSPIAHPWHESINEWMVMKRMMMNALKQRWKDFMVWFVMDQGYQGLKIRRCRILYQPFYMSNRRHDVDNCVPKFIIDGLVESGMIVDDDSEHITSLTLLCGVDRERPRSEIHIYMKEQDAEISEECKEESR